MSAHIDGGAAAFHQIRDAGGEAGPGEGAESSAVQQQQDWAFRAARVNAERRCLVHSHVFRFRKVLIPSDGREVFGTAQRPAIVRVVLVACVSAGRRPHHRMTRRETAPAEQRLPVHHRNPLEFPLSAM